MKCLIYILLALLLGLPALASPRFGRSVENVFCGVMLTDFYRTLDDDGTPKPVPLVPVVPQPELQIVPVEEKKPDNAKVPMNVPDDVFQHSWTPKKKKPLPNHGPS